MVVNDKGQIIDTKQALAHLAPVPQKIGSIFNRQRFLDGVYGIVIHAIPERKESSLWMADFIAIWSGSVIISSFISHFGIDVDVRLVAFWSGLCLFAALAAMFLIRHFVWSRRVKKMRARISTVLENSSAMMMNDMLINGFMANPKPGSFHIFMLRNSYSKIIEGVDEIPLHFVGELASLVVFMFDDETDRLLLRLSL